MVTVEKLSLFTADPAAAPAVDPAAVGLADDGLHPAVATWFARQFADGPTDAQAQGWAHIAAGRDTLIAAPTGSGKTLAGFLVCIDRLYRAHARGVDVAGRAQVAYVSPLKALAVDIAENLERPLREIAQVAAELGYDAPDLRVGVRTGDTTASERSSMVRRPPNFVITTPESLYLLVTARRSRDMLRTVDTVVVDEIHAMARDKRGSHLTLTLERLEHACAARPQRIGLSATQRPISLVAEMLCGTGAPAPCAVVDTGHRRALDLALELPQGELEAVVSAEQMGDVVDRIAALVGEHHTTIVFVNTRRLAERLAHQLGERLGDDVVSAHHGSLSKDRRYKIESRLRAGDLRALVATASLELGIDIGPVELVCQVGSPRSIATFLQRVGRANHSLRGVPKGRLFPLTRDELVESAALLAAVGKGELDAVIPPVAPLDILAQQIVAEVAATTNPRPEVEVEVEGEGRPEVDAGPADLGGWRLDDLYDLVRRAQPYHDLTRREFDEVVEMVSHGIATGRGRRAAYLHLDGINGEVRARPAARLSALTSGGAIPEIGDFRVVLEPDEMFVGTVNEDWAIESMAGDIFLLGTHAWQIRQVSSGVVRVVDAEGKPPTIPFWTGEAPARTAELSREVSALRSTLDGFLAVDDAEGARAWLRTVAPLDDAAVDQIVGYVAAGRAVLGVVPTHDDLVFERFFDEVDGMHLVVHSPYGGRVNRALGLALRKRFCVSFDFELQAAASDDAVVLSLGPHHSFPLADVPRFLTSHTVREVLQQAVLSPPSPMFQSRWRWNLNRSLVVLRWKGGRRNPPPIQRMESDDMMVALFPQAAACQENVAGPVEIPDHPIVRQTMHDTLTEGLDIDGLTELLDGIETGRVQVHFRDTTEASAFSHEILTAKPYAFLDDAETQDRRTNAVPLRRGLPVDLSTIGRLDPEAIARVRDEVAPSPRTADELHDLLGALVVTPARGEWRPLFDELAARGRVRSHTSDPSQPGSPVELWWTTELAAQAAVAVQGAPDDVHPASRWRRRCCGATSTSPVRSPPRRWPSGAGSARRSSRWASRCSRTTASRCRVPSRGPTGRTSPPARHPGPGSRPQGSSGAPAACWPACTRTRARPAAGRSSRSPPRTSCGSSCGGSTSPPAPRCAVTTAFARWSSSSRVTRRARPPGSRRSSPAASTAIGPACSTGCATTARSPGCACPRRSRRATGGRARPKPPPSPSPSATTSPGCCRPPGSPASPRRPRWGRRPRWSTRFGPGAPGSCPSWRPTRAGCPPTSNRPYGTAWPAACSPPTGSPPSARWSRARGAPRRPPGRSAAAGGVPAAPPLPPGGGRSSGRSSRSRTARGWPRWWPTSSCSGGAWSSATWRCTRACRCRGVTCSGRCAGSRIGAWCLAAASSPGSAVSSTPCRPRSTASRPSAAGPATASGWSSTRATRST